MRKTNLSLSSIKQYESVLLSFFRFLYSKDQNLQINDITKYNITEYQVYLRTKKKINNDVIKYRTKIIINLIDILYIEDEKKFSKIFKSLQGQERRNLFEISSWDNTSSYIQNLTHFEYKKLNNKLLENKNKNLLQLIYLQIQFHNNLTLNEILDLKKDVIYLSLTYKKNYETFINNKVEPVLIPEETMKLIKEAIEKRDDENIYIFVTENDNVVGQIHWTLFNYWCTCFSKILGKRVRHKYLCKKGVV